MRKGILGGGIVFLIIFLMSAVLGLQSFFVGKAFGQEVTESVTDLNRMAQTRSSAGLYFYNYLPQGGAYSIHQTSYELAGKGGGKTIDWRYNRLDDIRGRMYVKFRDESREYFNDRYGKSPEGLDCNFPDTDFRLTPFFNLESQKTGIRGQVSADKPLQAICQFPQGEVKVTGGQENYDAFFNATDNRYLVLMAQTDLFFRDLKSEWRRVDEYTGSYDGACGEPEDEVEEEAEDRALDDAREVEDLFEEIVNRYPETPGFSQTEARIIDQDEEFRYGSTDLYRGDAEYDTDSDPCDCDPDGDDCDTEYDSTVTIEPETTEVRYHLRDEGYRIPTEAGWKRLEFRVDRYFHDFRSD